VVRVAAAQTPEFRDDVEAATLWAIELARQAAAEGVSLLVFPEGYLQGYFTDEADALRVALELGSPQVQALAERLPKADPAVVMGLIEVEGDALFNTAVVLADGGVIGRYRKANLLPGEAAFTAGTEMPVFAIGELRFGINICFDTNFAWSAAAVKAEGGMLIVCPANNMMPLAKAGIWRDQHNTIRSQRCRETGLWLLSADVTGERDGRIAWGPTAMLDPDGGVAAQLPLDAPGLLVFDLPLPGSHPIPSTPGLPQSGPLSRGYPQ
jgi:predicted amidohydrolase